MTWVLGQLIGNAAWSALPSILRRRSDAGPLGRPVRPVPPPALPRTVNPMLGRRR